jgi:ribulose-5-phosphate 4-epimerase/fuculose-1-phosphate aldolase
MKFMIIPNHTNHPIRDGIVKTITQSFLNRGHQISTQTNGIKFVLNPTDITSPRIFRRKSQNIFVVSIIELEETADNLKTICYRALVRTLSNLLICIVKRNKVKSDEVFRINNLFFTTPEVGFYEVPFNQESLYQKILPIVDSHFAIENRITADLPTPYWKTTPVIEKLRYYGKELDRLGVLPTPFPLKSILTREDINHLYHLFEVKGISYGNLSAREQIFELGENTFWMTARGIDKSNIQSPGKDLLLVTGIEEETGQILISVPPTFDHNARVSVDAVEHDLIYRTYPGVGAIVHVHAWMDKILCTRQNFPCGTTELAKEVVGLLKQTKNPNQAVVGLKNHGLTITGFNLDDIFQRIAGKLQTEVPMFN